VELAEHAVARGEARLPAIEHGPVR
jgi:hypothetical protein